MQMLGEALVIKLWETIAEKGIGALFRPWQMRREGRVAIDLRREELLVLARAERDADEIRRGDGDTDVVRDPAQSDAPAPARNATEAMHFYDARQLMSAASAVAAVDVIRREINVTRAVLHAEEALENDTQVPPAAKVDDDWLFRWRDCASEISTDELQNLWGRILAGEVRAPGTYSLRTLDFLRNLSQAEAGAIARLSRFVIAGAVFKEAPELLSAEKFGFKDLLQLQQLGVISGVDAIGLKLTMTSNRTDQFSQALMSHGMVLLVGCEDPAKTLTLPVFVVTEIGKQILSLASAEANSDYMRAIGAHIKTQGFNVQLARYVPTGPNTIRISDEETL